MKSKAHVLFFLLLALGVPLTYGVFQEFFFEILYSLPIAQTEEFYAYTEANPFFTDALFCIVVFFVYLAMYLGLLWLTKDQRRLDAEESIRLRDEALAGRPNSNGWKPIRKKLRFSGMLLCLVVALGLGGLSTLWLHSVEWMDNSFFSESLGEFADAFYYDPELEDYIWPFLSIVILGPIIEELIFRGLMFYFASRIGHRWIPILLTGIVFGLWHVIPVQVVYTAFMGIGLGIVYHATGNIWYPIWIHVINNFLSRLPPFLDNPETWAWIEMLQTIAIAPAMIILIYLLISTSKSDMISKALKIFSLQKALEECEMEERNDSM